MKLRDDEGSMALFVAIFTSFLFLLAGLVIDGGVAISGRQRAADEAEQAARHAADDVSTSTLHVGGDPRINAGACARAAAVIAQYGDAAPPLCAVAAGGTEVTVIVTIKTDAKILSVIGFKQFTATSTATARPLGG